MTKRTLCRALRTYRIAELLPIRCVPMTAGGYELRVYSSQRPVELLYLLRTGREFRGLFARQEG